MAALVLLIASAFLLPVPGWAQAPAPVDTTRRPPVVSEPPDSSIAMSVTLPEVTVEGVLDRAASIPAAAHVTTLDADAVAASGAQSVADLLSMRSGAFVKQYGSTGLATLSMRGMGGTQTQVLLDGLRVANPQTGQVDLSLLPTLLIESVEVQHGAGSARHGSGSLGGTVHLRTLRPQTDPLFRVAGGGGAYDERHVSALASGGRGAWSGLVAGRYYRTDGDFQYRNSFLVPTQTLRRNGAGARTMTLFGRGTWRGDAQRWRLSGWWTKARRGLPGPASARSGGARQWDELGRVWTEGTLPLGAGTLELSAQGQRSRLRYHNPPTQTDRTTLTTATDADAELRYPLSSLGSITAGTTVGYDHASLDGGVDRVSGATFVDATLSLAPFELQPAVRLDAIGANGEPTVVPSPRLGVRLRPFDDVGLTLRGLVGRAFRYPTFNERYYEPGGTPGLQPEDGWTTEGGVSFRLARPDALLTVEATAFATRLTDKIVWRPSYVVDGVQVWSPSNVSRVYSQGLELSVRGRKQLRSNLSLSGGSHFTHTQAENRANPDSPAYGAQLPYVPRQTWKLWGRAEWRGLSVSATGRLVGPRFYSSDESKSLAPYRTIDVRAAYEWSFDAGRLALEAQVKNVLDRRYEIVRLYPMPPRHATLRLRFSLPSS
ncbi:TonB-dependent receptor plug domain-containing protein [Salinibacter ruber]|uniref:TonB-dependent receptor plug domain-containing protein n=1 Tax=Salinibacter ruber TaxID=146919 RepID=UPI002169D989|nr:TonB-dependent receptor [Salinibacter ruber]MCS4197131.1 iron complex outermembrane receptor protein [Salinibacter ruber]